MKTAKCEICAYLVSATTQAQANRTLGLHRRKEHGIKGGYKSRKMRDLMKQDPQEFMKLEAKRKHDREYKRRLRQSNQTAQPSTAEPCKLSECPQCGTRFYMMRGQ